METATCPSILDMIIRTVGSIYRKIFRAKPGRKPCKNDLTKFLYNTNFKQSISGDFTLGTSQMEHNQNRNVLLNMIIMAPSYRGNNVYGNLHHKLTYNSITGLRKGATRSRPSRLASDCTKAIGIM